MNDRHAPSEAINNAWDALFDAVPARWHVGRPSFDPERGAWVVTAWGPSRGRSRTPQSVSGMGEDEAAALRDLNDRLPRVPEPNGRRIEELRRRLRKAYVDGAEALARETFDRGLTTDELGRIIGRYPGT
jgi:hypothetical protein